MLQCKCAFCKEPNALEMSKKINSAAELLLAFIPEYHKEMEVRKRQAAHPMSGIVVNFTVSSASYYDTGSTNSGFTVHF